MMAELAFSDIVGVPKEKLGLGTVELTSKLLQKSNLGINDIGLIECNETFSAQVILYRHLAGANPDRININGGNIAMGYPVGCSGLRICVTLIHSMIQKQVELGMAVLCSGAGMGQGVIFRNRC